MDNLQNSEYSTYTQIIIYNFDCLSIHGFTFTTEVERKLVGIYQHISPVGLKERWNVRQNVILKKGVRRGYIVLILKRKYTSMLHSLRGRRGRRDSGRLDMHIIRLRQ